MNLRRSIAVAALGSLGMSGTASAHVDYVTPGGEPVAVVEFLVRALVGAGFAGYLLSPAVVPRSPTLVRLFGVSVGFLLLFGLATRAVAAVGLLSHLLALALNPTRLLVFEYVPGFVAIVLLGAGRPSADHVIAHESQTTTGRSTRASTSSTASSRSPSRRGSNRTGSSPRPSSAPASASRSSTSASPRS